MTSAVQAPSWPIFASFGLHFTTDSAVRQMTLDGVRIVPLTEPIPPVFSYLLARVIGAKAVADLDGSGELGVIGLQGYKIVQDYDAGFYSEVKQTCPACTIKETDLPLTSLGTSDGTDIVNFLRANPGIKGLLLGYDGLGSDLYTAAKSAGITLPKVYSIATIPTGVQAALAGELTATVPVDYADLGWRDADALARIFTGQTASALSQDVIYERPVIWSTQYHDVPSVAGSAFPAVVTNYQAEYEKLCGR